MNIFLKKRQLTPKGEKGEFVLSTRDKKFHIEIPVEKQYDSKELAKIHNAIMFTKQMFPNNAIEDAGKQMEEIEQPHAAKQAQDKVILNSWNKR